jgi:hypothetical protein
MKTQNNSKFRNVKEFKTLIERYETITLEEIEEVWSNKKEIESLDLVGEYSTKVAYKLTGFGWNFSCSLCIACDEICSECVYEINYGCFKSELRESYYNIVNSETESELLNAFRERAKVLRLYAKENNINIE